VDIKTDLTRRFGNTNLALQDSSKPLSDIDFNYLNVFTEKIASLSKACFPDERPIIISAPRPEDIFGTKVPGDGAISDQDRRYAYRRLYLIYNAIQDKTSTLIDRMATEATTIKTMFATRPLE
jgi:hypothetical protein